MSNYSYVAIDPQGVESRGTLDVSDQAEALRRIKETGVFRQRVCWGGRCSHCPAQTQASPRAEPRTWNLPFLAWGGGIGTKTLTAFTRQLATLVEAGMPLLRGLKTLQEQAECRPLRRVIRELSLTIENGSSFAEALALRPKVFNGLYVNMVKAGEIGGALDIT